MHASIFSSLYVALFIPERCLHYLRPLISTAVFCSTPSLASPRLLALHGTQQQQDLNLRRQECGSAAAPPTARIRPCSDLAAVAVMSKLSVQHSNSIDIRWPSISITTKY